MGVVKVKSYNSVGIVNFVSTQFGFEISRFPRQNISHSSSSETVKALKCLFFQSGRDRKGCIVLLAQS